MSEIDRLLAANEEYAAAARTHLDSSHPRRRLAVVTCMDARIDVFAVLGLDLGEASILRNAGARVTDDVLRSLALATHVLGVDTVLVMQHTKCGLAGSTDDELRDLTGAEVHFAAIADHHADLRADVDLLARTSYLEQLEVVAGVLYDTETGAIDDIVRWQREDR